MKEVLTTKKNYPTFSAEFEMINEIKKFLKETKFYLEDYNDKVIEKITETENYKKM